MRGSRLHRFTMGRDSGMTRSRRDSIHGPSPAGLFLFAALCSLFAAGAAPIRPSQPLVLSGDVAVMAPGTHAGAAHPVMMGGGEVSKTMEAKIENDSAAYLRSICERRGRNSVLAEAGVRQSKSYTETEALNGRLIDAVA